MFLLFSKIITKGWSLKKMNTKMKVLIYRYINKDVSVWFRKEFVIEIYIYIYIYYRYTNVNKYFGLL